MPLDRSARTLIAAVLLMAALLLAMNHAVVATSILDWGLPLILFVIGLVFALLPEGAATTTDIEPFDEAADIREIHAVPQAAAPTAAPAPVAAVPKPDEPDDLTRVEGIGPKIAAALVAAGIDSYQKLSVASDKELRAAVDAANIRLAPSLSTWAEQATYLMRGDIDGFEALKATLKGGRRRGR